MRPGIDHRCPAELRAVVQVEPPGQAKGRIGAHLRKRERHVLAAHAGALIGQVERHVQPVGGRILPDDHPRPAHAAIGAQHRHIQRRHIADHQIARQELGAAALDAGYAVVEALGVLVLERHDGKAPLGLDEGARQAAHLPGHRLAHAGIHGKPGQAHRGQLSHLAPALHALLRPQPAHLLDELARDLGHLLWLDAAAPGRQLPGAGDDHPRRPLVGARPVDQGIQAAALIPVQPAVDGLPGCMGDPGALLGQPALAALALRHGDQRLDGPQAAERLIDPGALVGGPGGHVQSGDGLIATAMGEPIRHAGRRSQLLS